MECHLPKLKETLTVVIHSHHKNMRETKTRQHTKKKFPIQSIKVLAISILMPTYKYKIKKVKKDLLLFTETNIKNDEKGGSRAVVVLVFYGVFEVSSLLQNLRSNIIQEIGKNSIVLLVAIYGSILGFHL